jgi:hypothetical protein
VKLGEPEGAIMVTPTPTHSTATPPSLTGRRGSAP